MFRKLKGEKEPEARPQNSGNRNLDPKQYTKFTKSSPWGYKADEVEEKIAEYEDALRGLTDRVRSYEAIISEKDATITRYEDELRSMHLQMSSLELPNVEEVIETHVLDGFKAYNTPEPEQYHRAPEPQQPAAPFEIVSNQGDEYKEEKKEKPSQGFTIVQ